MSRTAAHRLADILAACDAIDAHLARGPAGDPLGDDLPQLRAAVERLLRRG